MSRGHESSVRVPSRRSVDTYDHAEYRYAIGCMYAMLWDRFYLSSLNGQSIWFHSCALLLFYCINIPQKLSCIHVMYSKYAFRYISIALELCVQPPEGACSAVDNKNGKQHRVVPHYSLGYMCLCFPVVPGRTCHPLPPPSAR